jgi:tRNA threonylcarbamoyladenosine biosynthesis protein TsaB
VTQLLAIETSSEACSVALSWSGEVRQWQQHAPLRHAELLLPAVRALLGEAGVSLGSLDALVFGRGPGSFTSLRIGIGVVQGLAWGAELPVVPVSSLAAVAQQLVWNCSVPLQFPANILVALDARMNEVFHCTYGVDELGRLQELAPEAVSPASAVNAGQPGLTTAAGNGFERYPELALLGRSLCRVHAGLVPTAAALLPLAEQWLRSHQALPAAQAQPVYVRNHVADKPGVAKP